MTATVIEVIETSAPDTSDVVFKLIAAPVVPTCASQTVVAPPLSRMRAKVAVPVATAVPAVMALAVSTPPVGEPNAGLPNVSVAKSVLPESAVLALTGCVPE